jgi:beta-glucosidase
MSHRSNEVLDDSGLGKRVAVTHKRRTARATLGALGLLVAATVSCGSSDDSSGGGHGGASDGGASSNGGDDGAALGGRANGGETTRGDGGADADGGESAAGGGANGGRTQGGTSGGGTAGTDANAEGGNAGDSGGGVSGRASDGGAAGAGGDAKRPLDLSGVEPTSLEGSSDPPGLAAARDRAQTLLAGLSIAEKVALVQGTGGGVYVGNVRAVTGVPALTLQDGPAGVARFRGVTAFPAPIALAASWDRDLVERWGEAMGAEQRGKGVMIQLGPMMNLARTPAGGRNFEGFGEDPFLSAELAARDVLGIQSQKVVATAKHFVGNEQETNRMGGNSQIDERTLHEVYYAPFEASVRAGVGSVMCAYNRLNGVFACENPTILGDLKNRMGFTGFVMSDWSATTSNSAAAAGLDMEMPYGLFFSQIEAYASPARIDDMVTRILTALVRVGVLDDPPSGSTSSVVTTAEHAALAREAATESVTLLKNEANVLPLDPSLSVVVIGDAGSLSPSSVGGGSAAVIAPYITTPLAAIQARVGADASVTYVPDSGDVAAAAAAADVAVVFESADSSEGYDRTSLSLVNDSTIATVAAANPNTIVVLNTPGAVLMPWLNQVRGVLLAWYPGQENGSAITSVLYGDANPSGKLPVSFPANDSDLPVPVAGAAVPYTEGLAIGYRALDAAGKEPLFPFGHGLSYTTFEYEALELRADNAKRSLVVRFNLSNTGARAGSEVAQLYLSWPSEAGEPPRVLRGFERLTLAAGERRTVTIELQASAFSCWSSTSHARYIPSGQYQISIGSSSRNLPLTAAIELTGFGP